MVPYHIVSYHTGVPPDKLITGTDPYVGYCIPHTDKYHVNKHIMSFFAFSVKALIIKIIGVKDPTNSRALFCAQIINNVT